MSNNGGTEPRMSPDATDPVIEDAGLPRMPSSSEITDATDSDRDAEGARMGPPVEDTVGEAGEQEPPPQQEQAELGPPESARQGGYMAPHSEAVARTADARAPRPEQRPREKEQSEPGGQEGYVRLRVVGSGDQWRVESQTVVPGPLAVPERLHYGWAYEARYRGHRVGLGVMPDLGEERGFPDPEGRVGMEGHHIVASPVTEFVVRITVAALRDADLERLEIILYRVDDPPPDAIGPQPLDEQFRGRVARVAVPGRRQMR